MNLTTLDVDVEREEPAVSDRQLYLFVGGPLDGQVQPHDGGPLIVEPSTMKFERVDQNFGSDVVTFRVSTQVALYIERTVPFAGGCYLRVMSTSANPTPAQLDRAAAKALGLTLWASNTPTARRADP